MRVLVVGGSGFIGAHVLRALAAAAPALETTVASHRAGAAPVHLDLNDPRTFDAIAPYDCVVDCADGFRAPPDALARYCLEHGKRFVETSADVATHERLLALRDLPGTGAVVLGAGLFPGLSNVLARAACDASPGGCARLDVGVSLGAASGAGRAMCELMTRSIAQPAVRFEASARVLGPAVAPGPALPFFAHASRRTARAGLCEAPLLFASTRVPTIATFYALRPSLLITSFRALAALTPRTGRARQCFLWLVGASLALLRALVLRGVGTAIELVAIADRGTPRERAYAARVSDGQRATGYLVAAMLLELAARPCQGVRTADELFALGALVERVRALAGDALAIAYEVIPSRAS